jgi:hypothetical protein
VRFLSDLLYLFNEQFSSNNFENIRQFIAVRQTLCKTVIRVLALYVNYATQCNKDVDETFYNSVLVFLKNERNNKDSNIINYLMNDPTYGSFNLFNKLSVKMLMVLIIQKSLSSKITCAENELLNLLK